MRRTVPWLALALLALPGGVAAGDESGIRWATDLEAGLARAAREGRPVLFAVNALETESANRQLHAQHYPSAAWGRATREYVCFVCNPNTHESGADGACSRYGAPLSCAHHRAALDYVLRRFAPVERTLISPQHVILEPDGGLAWRKEYYTGVVGPDLLERFYVQLSPERVYEMAGSERASHIDALDNAPAREVTERARAWLRTGDLQAAAGILRAIDFAFDEERRLGLVEALDATPPTQRAVLGLLLDEAGARPDDRPAETLALARALLPAHRALAVRLLARIAVRTTDAKLRRRAFALWTAPDDGEEPRGAEERAALREARLLAGEARAGVGGDTAVEAVPRWLRARVRRAEAVAGRREGVFPSLPEALAEAAGGALRGALLEAAPEEVQAAQEDVQALLEDPRMSVRTAAALALLAGGAGPAGDVAALLWRAIQDPVEGPETRRAAVQRLGADPGWNEDVWREAVERAVRRGP